MAEPNKRMVIDRIDFGKLFAFPSILNAVTAALQPPRLLIALFAVIALVAIGRAWDKLFSETMPPDFEYTVGQAAAQFHNLIYGVLALSADRSLGALHALFIGLPIDLWNNRPWFLIVMGLATTAVLAISGGAIARMSAHQVAAGDRVSLREAADFAVQRWLRLVWAMLLPLVIAGLIGLIIAIAGAAMVAYVDVLVGTFYGLALVLGFLVAFLIAGYLLGFPLLTPAISSENCDAADAMQRAYAYVVGRPLHLLGYWAVAMFGLALGFVLVSAMAVLTLDITASFFGALTSHPAESVAGGFDIWSLSPRTNLPEDLTWHQQWAAGAIQFWQAMVLCLVVAYVISYFYSVSTIIYLLMRRVCDGQEIEDIWRPGLVPGTLAPMPMVNEPQDSKTAPS